MARVTKARRLFIGMMQLTSDVAGSDPVTDASEPRRLPGDIGTVPSKADLSYSGSLLSTDKYSVLPNGTQLFPFFCSSV
jgi:hypothetical protein